MQAQDKFKYPMTKTVHRNMDGKLEVTLSRKSNEREMCIHTFMETLPERERSKQPNRAKRHRLNPGRRLVAMNRAAR